MTNKGYISNVNDNGSHKHYYLTKPESFCSFILYGEFMTQVQLRMRVLTGSILANLASQGALAADNMPSVTLQTITVTAPGYTQREANKQDEAVYAEDYVPMQQATHLGDFLSSVPGVQVGGTSSMDQQIYIRGVNDKNLKVTVDGARQENHFFHHAGRLAIDSDLLKKAEVSVGNNSVTLGNNAGGGAVAFTTVDAEDLLRPGQRLGAKVKLAYHSNDEQFHETATLYGQPTDHTDFLLSYGQRDSEGGEDGRGNHIQGDDIRIKNILAKVSVSPSDAHKVSLSYKNYDDHGNYPFRPEFGYSSDANKNQIYPGYNTSEDYTLGYQYTPSDQFSLDFNAYHTEREFLVQGLRGGKLFPIETMGNIDGATLQLKNKLVTPTQNSDITHQLVYGGEAYRKSGTNANDQKQEASSYGVYLEDQIDFGRIGLTPGVRYDRYEASQMTGGGKFNQFSGALAGNIELTDRTNVFASYTQFFSGPPLPETLLNRYQDVVLVNDDLKPETGANTEVGISTYLNDLLSPGDRTTFSAKYFDTDFDDSIEHYYQDCNLGGEVVKDCISYRNTGEANVKGYEVGSNYQYDNLMLNASYEHAKGTTSNGTSFRNTGDTLRLGFGYALDNGLKLGVDVAHVKDVVRKELPRGSDKIVEAKYPSYHTIDVYGSYTPAALSNLTLDLGVYNLTNQYYIRHTANPTSKDAEPGRNIKVSASYRF